MVLRAPSATSVSRTAARAGRADARRGRPGGPRPESARGGPRDPLTATSTATGRVQKCRCSRRGAPVGRRWAHSPGMSRLLCSAGSGASRARSASDRTSCAASTTTSTPTSSPSSLSSLGVDVACTGPRRPSTSTSVTPLPASRWRTGTGMSVACSAATPWRGIVPAGSRPAPPPRDLIGCVTEHAARRPGPHTHQPAPCRTTHDRHHDRRPGRRTAGRPEVPGQLAGPAQGRRQEQPGLLDAVLHAGVDLDGPTGSSTSPAGTVVSSSLSSASPLPG